MKRKDFVLALVLLLVSGCARMERGCASGCANNLGADWLIVQYNNVGTPINCWKLDDVSVANEGNSDGIYWASDLGHLVHVGGWYNRVQVEGGRWSQAASEVGIDLARCTGGRYVE